MSRSEAAPPPFPPSDPELQSIACDSGNGGRGPIAVADEGAGAALVMIHGLPGSHRDFRWLAGALAAGEHPVRVVRPDMPGFGQSAAGRVGITVAERAAAVMAVLDALEIDRATLLGHSMGGPVAVHLAANAPDRVAGVALLASVGLQPHRLYRRSGVRFASGALAIPGLRQLLMPRLRQSFDAAGFPRSLSDAARVLATRQAGAVRFPAQRRAVATLQCPTLVAWAIDDRLVEDPIVQELADACPDGPRQRFETGGHNIQKTRAAELAGVLGPWVPSLK